MAVLMSLSFPTMRRQPFSPSLRHTTLCLAVHFIDPVHNLMHQITDNNNERDRRMHRMGTQV